MSFACVILFENTGWPRPVSPGSSLPVYGKAKIGGREETAGTYITAKFTLFTVGLSWGHCPWDSIARICHPSGFVNRAEAVSVRQVKS